MFTSPLALQKLKSKHLQHKFFFQNVQNWPKTVKKFLGRLKMFTLKKSLNPY